MSAPAHDWREVERERAQQVAQAESELTAREDYGFPCDRCHEKPAVANLDKEFLCDGCHAIRLRRLNLELTR